MGERGAEGRVEDLLVKLQEGSGQSDVSKGDLLADKEGAGLKDNVENTENTLHLLLGASSCLKM